MFIWSKRSSIRLARTGSSPTFRQPSRSSFENRRWNSSRDRTGSAAADASPRASAEGPEHPTSNIEHPTSNDGPNWARWGFDVGCWMLDVPPLRPSPPQISSATARAVFSPHCSLRMRSIVSRGRAASVAKASLILASATRRRRSGSSRMPTMLPRADLSSMPALELGGRLAVAKVTSALPCSCAVSSCRITFGSMTLSPATTSTFPSNRIRSNNSAPLRAASPVPSGRSWKA